MPQINRVRIVNFTYNDGRRLIADELYDFSAKDGSEALNVLINLANGGGKSVLVQLMLQPIIPKATVAGRKIESFFTRSGDHCFILLEWRKDESTEKLMTGIAMAASESLSKETEDSDKLGVRFYTFFSEYAGGGSRYDIQSIDLSRKEKGLFVPADFDYVRTLSKRSNGSITCYSMDNRPQWFRKLSEFGIYEQEWRTIEDLNSDEGGLTQFFEKFTSSTHLLNKLLIPTIERKLAQQIGREDTTLTTMLLGHVSRYASQQDTLREKETYDRFLTCIGELKPTAESLWNEYDSLETCIASLFGFSDAIEAELIDIQQKSQKAETSLKRLDEKLHHIEWERVSEAYYQASTAFEQALAVSKEADEQECAAEETAAQTKHALLVMECASYYEKLAAVENDIKVLQEQIRQKESGSDAAETLASLHYSAALAVRKALDEIDGQLSDAEAVYKKLNVQLADYTKEVSDAERKRDKLKDTWTRLDAQYTSAADETDNAVDKLHCELYRRFDGLYAMDELDEIRKEREQEASQLSSQKKQVDDHWAELSKELEALPQTIADKRIQLSSLQDDVKRLTAEYDTYKGRDEEMRRICSLYGLDAEQRFTSGVCDYISEAILKNQAAQDDMLRKISVTEEGILAAERGSLHVPQAVIDYLNATGLTYTTCEKYLLGQVAEGTLTQERLNAILKNYPTVAYGILMQDTDMQKLLTFDREKWLPAMIPLFSPNMLNRVLNVDQFHFHAIAFYSEAYFENPASYLNHLKEEKSNLECQRDRLRAEAGVMNSYLETAKAFTYPAGWAADHENRISQAEAAVDAQNDIIDELQKKQSQLSDEKTTCEEQASALAEQLLANRDFMKLLDTVHEWIRKENNLYDQKSMAYGEYLDQDAMLSELRKKKDGLDRETADAGERLRKVNETAETLENARIDIGECADAPVIEGDWASLYSQYSKLAQTISDDMERLRGNLSHNQKEQAMYLNELQKRDISEDEYKQTVWSDEAEKRLKTALGETEVHLITARDNARRLGKEMSRAEGALEKEKELIAVYGEPLPASEIGRNFDSRTADINQQKASIKKEQDASDSRKRALDSVKEKLEDILKQRIRPDKSVFVKTEKNVRAQYESFIGELTNREKTLNLNRAGAVHRMQEMHQSFLGTNGGVSEAFVSMIALLESDSRGDKYFSLNEQLQSASDTAEKAIARIQTDLVEFDKSRMDVIKHCVYQGKRIYDGLKRMAASSQVTVYDGKPKKQMIRFGIPDTIDEASSNASVEAEIDKGTRELADLLGTGATEADMRKRADQIVGSQNLLRKYIRTEEIAVQAFKIDQNSDNAGYRTWEQTQVNNSGAEKFVVYFAVVLSLMNYTRADTGTINDRMLHSALILDNPFGSTSSKHILDPMFAIAKHFRVQMICLSDINKSDVINCFDIIIRAIVKKRQMSTGEILTHEGNENIEHGFYRAQIEI